MRLTNVQPTCINPHFGQKQPLVASRFEIDLSEASAKHKPLILAAIRKFNASNLVTDKDNIFKAVPDGIKFIFVSNGGQVSVNDEDKQGRRITRFTVPEDINPNSLFVAIESVSQGLYHEYD